MKIKKTTAKNDKSKITGRGLKTIFAKFMVFIGVPIILTFLAISFIILSLLSNTVTQLTNSSLQAQSSSAANEINAYFEKYYMLTNQLSMDDRLEPMFRTLAAGQNIEEHESYQAIRRTMANAQEADSQTLLFVWMADVDSSQLAYSTGDVNRDGWDINSRPWFSQIRDESKTIMTEPYEDTATKEQVVSIISPVYRAGSQEIIGVVGIDFTLAELGNTVKSYNLGQEGFYILTTKGGQIIYHPDEKNININIAEADLSENIKNAISTESEEAIEYYSHGEQSHGFVSSIGNTGWTIVTGLPHDEFKADFLAARTTMLTAFAIAIVVIVLILLVLSRGIVSPIKSLTNAANQIAEGNLDVTALVGTRDETGQMAAAINKTVLQLRRYTAYIKEITFTLESMARGDMRISLKEDYIGEFSSIKTAFDEISVSLNDTLGGIEDAAEQVATGSDQVAAGAQALSQGATEQASSVEELSSTIVEVSESLKKSTDRAQNVSISSGEAGREVAESNEQMQHLMAAMEEITNTSREIGNIIKTIDGIAFQTNILALNAAIEAARAGVAGKGFAVVADEVRNLAAKSAEAANNTTALVESTLNAIESGRTLAEGVALSMESVVSKVYSVDEIIQEIAKDMERESTAVGEIATGVDQISAVVHNNSATAEESAATSEELSGQALMLKQQLSKFQLAKTSRKNPWMGEADEYQGILAEGKTSTVKIKKDDIELIGKY